MNILQNNGEENKGVTSICLGEVRQEPVPYYKVINFMKNYTNTLK
jgi:hypothetical protein